MAFELDFKKFEQVARERGLDVPIDERNWFFVSFVPKVGGKFQGGTFVRSKGVIHATDDTITKSIMPEGTRSGTCVEVPDEKLPPPEYRDRFLTPDEVKAVWPWIKL